MNAPVRSQVKVRPFVRPANRHRPFRGGEQTTDRAHRPRATPKLTHRARFQYPSSPWSLSRFSHPGSAPAPRRWRRGTSTPTGYCAGVPRRSAPTKRLFEVHGSISWRRARAISRLWMRSVPAPRNRATNRPYAGLSGWRTGWEAPGNGRGMEVSFTFWDISGHSGTSHPTWTQSLAHPGPTTHIRPDHEQRNHTFRCLVSALLNTSET